MKPIRCLNFDLQIQHTETGFRSQVLNSPAGEVSGSCGAIFTDVELENYLLKLGRPRRANTRRIDSPEYAVATVIASDAKMPPVRDQHYARVISNHLCHD